MKSLPMLQSVPEGKRREAIVELITDITQMRLMSVKLQNQLLVLETQILRGEFIIEELMDQAEERIIPIIPPPTVEEITVPQCVDECYPHMPDIFTSGEMLKSCREKHPEIESKLKTGVYVYLTAMEHKKRIKKNITTGYWHKLIK